jgi:hypothetical protein
MSSSSCAQQYAGEVNRFEALLYASLLLTVANSVATRVLISRGMALQKIAYYLWTTGGIKVILAMTIFSIIPTCPGATKRTNYPRPLRRRTKVSSHPGLTWPKRGLSS